MFYFYDGHPWSMTIEVISLLMKILHPCVHDFYSPSPFIHKMKCFHKSFDQMLKAISLYHLKYFPDI